MTVVLDLTRHVQGLWHTIVTDNFFTSVKLFHELICPHFWATGTVRTTRRGLPKELKRLRSEDHRGSILIKMHRLRQMVAVSWQEKKIVTFLSTSEAGWRPGVKVQRRTRGKEKPVFVPSTPVHLEYQQMMRGVDATDQIRGNYSVQLSTHRWWHKILWFVIDQTITNCWILYRDEMEELGLHVLSHVSFQLAIAEHLVKDTARIDRRRRKTVSPVNRPGQPACEPEKGRLRRLCVVCRSKQKGFCAGCRYTFMCPIPCWGIYHRPENVGKY